MLRKFIGPYHFACLIIIATCLQVVNSNFFPESIFDRLDSKEDNEYMKSSFDICETYLKSMEEKSLYQASRTSRELRCYRLLWLPSFHPPISVTIYKHENTIALSAVILTGKGAGKPGKIAGRRIKRLTDDDWTLLLVAVEQAKFWNMQTFSQTNWAEGLIMDGDFLLVEGVEDGKYHVVHRLQADSNYAHLCYYILKLSGYSIDEAWSAYHGEAGNDGRGRR